MVIVVDDEARENEGDLVMAAEHTTAADINFMASQARGLICLTLTPERCRKLGLPLMVADSKAVRETNFTRSIDAAQGIATGISAADRAHTIAVAVSASASEADIVQPGHIFPLMAIEGGVLARAGHTEAGCDLARLAGMEPAATIVEIMNPDGTMARRPDLEKFSGEHNLKLGSIENMIRYRLHTEKSLDRIGEMDIADDTLGSLRMHLYRERVNQVLHLAFVKGDLAAQGNASIAVRVHVHDLLADLFDISSGGWPLHDALQRIAQEPAGVVVLLRTKNEDQLIKSHFDKTPPAAPPVSKDAEEFRNYGVGAQILADLGVKKIRPLSAPKVMRGLAAFGIEIEEFITD